VDSITQTITEYASTSVFAHLAKEAVHPAKQRLIDSLCCAVGAHDLRAGANRQAISARSTPGKYPGRVLYFGDRLPVESAAFINTSMIRNFDFNDRYPGGYPSDCLGALLAPGRNVCSV
jgi:2-methylcitrate dehydratase